MLTRPSGFLCFPAIGTGRTAQKRRLWRIRWTIARVDLEGLPGELADFQVETIASANANEIRMKSRAFLSK
jgi:hypothetical protein